MSARPPSGTERAGRAARAAPDLGRPLPRAFFERDAVAVARALLGRRLVHDTPEGRLAGIVIETEAYRGARDPASHAFRGRTGRNATMFGPAGHAYVYFIYGVHHCLNVVTGREGEAGAVLLRALEPVAGLEAMRRRRRGAPEPGLARGPGNLAAALGLTLAHDGLDLVAGPLWVSDLAPRRRGLEVVAGPRIGISRAVAEPWRFHLAGHPGVSGPPAFNRAAASSAPVAGRADSRAGRRVRR